MSIIRKRYHLAYNTPSSLPPAIDDDCGGRNCGKTECKNPECIKNTAIRRERMAWIAARYAGGAIPVLPRTRPVPAPRPKKPSGKPIYPAPVYVATFAGGETIRMSYWSPINKPLRQDAARKLACEIIGAERNRPRDASYGLPYGVPVASDIVAGHTERKDPGHAGEIVQDPFFAPAAATVHRAKRTPKAKPADTAASVDVAILQARIAELEASLERAIEEATNAQDALAWEKHLTAALAA